MNPEFSLEIGGEGGDMKELSKFYGLSDPTGALYLSRVTHNHSPSRAVESYNFTYYEDLFAQDAETPTLVNVLAKSYRHVTLCVATSTQMGRTDSFFLATTLDSTSSASSTTAAARLLPTGASSLSPRSARRRTFFCSLEMACR